MKLGKDGFIPYDIEVYSGGGDGAVLKWQNDSTLKTWARSELGSSLQYPIICMLYQQELDILITGHFSEFLHVFFNIYKFLAFKGRELVMINFSCCMMRLFGLCTFETNKQCQ